MTTAVQARVLIVAQDDAVAEPLAEGLDRLGWRALVVRDSEAASAAVRDLQIEAAIVDLASGGPTARGLADRLKRQCAPRRLPVVAIGDPGPAIAADGFDLALAAPLHPAQAVMRLESLVRMAV